MRIPSVNFARWVLTPVGDLYNAPLAGNVGVGVTDPSERLDVDGALRIGAATNTNAGTFEWSGTNFRGHTGSAWVNLDAPDVTPGGSSRDLQFNNAGAFDGSSGLQWSASGLFQFGGPTSSFPALKRSAADLHARLADDSAFANISGLTPTLDNHFSTKLYVDNLIAGLDWQDSVLDKDLTAPPGSPSTGDRYIVAAVATGAWATHEEKIAEWNGASWNFIVPNKGYACLVEDESTQYTYNDAYPAGAWVLFSTSIGAHALGSSQHSVDTLANLNLKVSDATLVDTGDSRFSDDRTASGLRTATTLVGISGATAPTIGQILKATSSTNATWQDESITNPAGADTQVQFNSGGSTFGASSSFTWNNTSKALKINVISALGGGFLSNFGTVATSAFPQAGFYRASSTGTISGRFGPHIGFGTDDVGTGSYTVGQLGIHSQASNPANSQFAMYLRSGGVYAEKLRMNGSGELSIAETASGATPESGWGAFYVKTDGKPYFKNDAGTESPLDTQGQPPGGATTQLQFNDGGVFAGDAGLTWDKTSKLLLATGTAGVSIQTPIAHVTSARTGTNYDGGAGISSFYVRNDGANIYSHALAYIGTSPVAGDAYLDLGLGGAIIWQLAAVRGSGNKFQIGRGGSLTGFNNGVDFTIDTNGRTGVGIGTATANESLHIGGAIQVGGAAVSSAGGTIQWTGSDLQGRVGGAWRSLTTQSTAPAGADTQLQFNDGGSFGGTANLTWDDNSLLVIGTGASTGTIVGRSTTAFFEGIRAEKTAGNGGQTVMALVLDPAAPADGDEAVITWRGADSLGAVAATGQLGVALTDVTSGSEDADFVFRLSASGSAPTEKMRLTSGGKLGIGITSFAYGDLFIRKSKTSDIILDVRNDGTTLNSSGAVLKLTSGNLGGDAWALFNNQDSGAKSWAVGNDRSQSNGFIFCDNTTLGGNTRMKIARTADGGGVTITNGLAVGHGSVPADDTVSVGISTFLLDVNAGVAPRLGFDTNDRLEYNRTGNQFNLVINNTTEMSVTASGASITNGLGVFGTTPPGSQPAKINDPTDLPTALTAIAALIDIIEGAGLAASV